MAGALHTVIETEIYLRSAERLMTEAERIAIVNFFAANPQAGDVIPGAGGLRKARVPPVHAARFFGGELDITSLPAKGTTVRVRIPVRRRATEPLVETSECA